MKEQQHNLIEYIKSLNTIRGCITGSALLPEYFEGSDVDLFMYDIKSFTKMYYTLINNPMFLILDAKEQWKAHMFEDKEEKYGKVPIMTIKLVYNTCIPLNIIFKKDASNIFSVLSSFDMDLVCLGYCLQSKQYLDLTENSAISRIVNINKWNPKYSSTNIWELSRILRQFSRVIKYSKRGYNTDALALKYKEIIQSVIEFENIFNSEIIEEKLVNIKTCGEILTKIIDKWLETKEISPEEEILIDEIVNKM